MKKKLLIIITCLLLALAGTYYSFTYQPKADIKSDLTTQGESGEEALEKDNDHIDNNSDIDQTSQISNNLNQDKHEDEDIIYIHVCGAVVEPGVYQGLNGMRIVEFIKLAGGLRGDAAGDYINQAQIAIDGQRLYIPTMGELEDVSTAEFIQGDSDVDTTDGNGEELININIADVGELMSLPGIGQSKANSIVEYRKNNGNFRSIEDLMKITGIKEGLFNQISSYITVK